MATLRGGVKQTGIAGLGRYDRGSFASPTAVEGTQGRAPRSVNPMSLRRVFVDAVAAGKASVGGERAHHLARVARLRPDERVEVSDHQRLYTARVAAVSGKSVEFVIETEIAPPPPGRPVCLLLSLIKFARFEWAIEKTTELGVTSIVPLLADRSDRGLAAAAAKRSDRWRRIADEAAQQARRMAPPSIEPPAGLDQAVAKAGDWDRFILDRNGKPLPDALREADRSLTSEVVVLVGPEGGWSDRERQAAVEHGFTTVGLGANILRTETAAIAALAVVTGAAAPPGQP